MLLLYNYSIKTGLCCSSLTRTPSASQYYKSSATLFRSCGVIALNAPAWPRRVPSFHFPSYRVQLVKSTAPSPCLRSFFHLPRYAPPLRYVAVVVSMWTSWPLHSSLSLSWISFWLACSGTSLFFILLPSTSSASFAVDASVSGMSLHNTPSPLRWSLCHCPW